MTESEPEGRDLALLEHAVLLWVLCEFAESDASIAHALEEQARTVSVVGGHSTMRELSVPTGAGKVMLPDGPLPVRVLSTDERGDLTGEVLVWIADGHLSALEYAWYTDDAPGAFPRPSLLKAG